jgi:hypothetical protein
MAVSSDTVGDWAADEPSHARTHDRRHARTRLMHPAMALLATVVTIATTGFAFGVSNNVYHLPYVLDLASLPQFAHDQFYQDLKYIVSYVWPFERLLATEWNIRILFFISYSLALLLYYASLIAMVKRLAPPGPVGLIAALLLGLTYLDSGYSLLAGENIIGGYFTETQVATALVTASVALAMDRKLVTAIALLGVTFDVQYELSLWGLVALIGVSVALLRDGVPVLRSWVLGGALAVVLAAPAALWLADSIASVGRFDGNYIDYLNLVEPSQWLVWTAPLKKWVLFSANLVLAFGAFAVLGADAKPARAAFIGLLCVFVAGCAMPFITTNQWILNLRLMAADGFLQVLASAAAVAVVVRDMRESPSTFRVGTSIVIAASLVLDRHLLPIGALAMLARLAMENGELATMEREMRAFDYASIGRWAFLPILLLLIAGGWLRATQPLNWIEPEPQRDPGFASLISWVQQNTPPSSTFLVDAQIGTPFDKFQMWSKRAVWLDDRRGASAMWDPRYYRFWKERIDQLWAMHSPTQRLPFACGAGVDYYTDRTAPGFDLAAPDISRFVVFQDGGYFVIDAKAYCAASHGNTVAKG